MLNRKDSPRKDFPPPRDPDEPISYYPDFHITDPQPTHGFGYDPDFDDEDENYTTPFGPDVL